MEKVSFSLIIFIKNINDVLSKSTYIDTEIKDHIKALINNSENILERINTTQTINLKDIFSDLFDFLKTKSNISEHKESIKKFVIDMIKDTQSEVWLDFYLNDLFTFNETNLEIKTLVEKELFYMVIYFKNKKEIKFFRNLKKLKQKFVQVYSLEKYKKLLNHLFRFKGPFKFLKEKGKNLLLKCKLKKDSESMSIAEYFISSDNYLSKSFTHIINWINLENYTPDYFSSNDQEPTEKNIYSSILQKISVEQKINKKEIIEVGQFLKEVYTDQYEAQKNMMNVNSLKNIEQSSINVDYGFLLIIEEKFRPFVSKNFIFLNLISEKLEDISINDYVLNEKKSDSLDEELCKLMIDRFFDLFDDVFDESEMNSPSKQVYLFTQKIEKWKDSVSYICKSFGFCDPELEFNEENINKMVYFVSFFSLEQITKVITSEEFNISECFVKFLFNLILCNIKYNDSLENEEDENIVSFETAKNHIDQEIKKVKDKMTKKNEQLKNMFSSKKKSFDLSSVINEFRKYIKIINIQKENDENLIKIKNNKIIKEDLEQIYTLIDSLKAIDLTKFKELINLNGNYKEEMIHQLMSRFCILIVFLKDHFRPFELIPSLNKETFLPLNKLKKCLKESTNKQLISNFVINEDLLILSQIFSCINYLMHAISLDTINENIVKLKKKLGIKLRGFKKHSFKISEYISNNFTKILRNTIISENQFEDSVFIENYFSLSEEYKKNKRKIEAIQEFLSIYLKKDLNGLKVFCSYLINPINNQAIQNNPNLDRNKLLKSKNYAHNIISELIDKKVPKDIFGFILFSKLKRAKENNITMHFPKNLYNFVDIKDLDNFAECCNYVVSMIGIKKSIDQIIKFSNSSSDLSEKIFNTFQNSLTNFLKEKDTKATLTINNKKLTKQLDQDISALPEYQKILEMYFKLDINVLNNFMTHPSRNASHYKFEIIHRICKEKKWTDIFELNQYENDANLIFKMIFSDKRLSISGMELLTLDSKIELKINKIDNFRFLISRFIKNIQKESIPESKMSFHKDTPNKLRFNALEINSDFCDVYYEALKLNCSKNLQFKTISENLSIMRDNMTKQVSDLFKYTKTMFFPYNNLFGVLYSPHIKKSNIKKNHLIFRFHSKIARS